MTDANGSGESNNDNGTAPPAGGEGTNSSSAPRTFTQDEMNAIIQDRLNRERGKYADYEDLKGKASKLDQLEAERLSDIERAQAEATSAAERASKAEEALKGERLRNAVYAESVKAGAVDPDAVLALLDRTSLLSDDGTPTGVGDAITALLETKPYLKAQLTAPKGNIGQGERGAPTGGATFTREQLKDSKFFEANKAAIFDALAKGQITD